MTLDATKTATQHIEGEMANVQRKVGAATAKLREPEHVRTRGTISKLL